MTVRTRVAAIDGPEASARLAAGPRAAGGRAAVPRTTRVAPGSLAAGGETGSATPTPRAAGRAGRDRPVGPRGRGDRAADVLGPKAVAEARLRIGGGIVRARAVVSSAKAIVVVRCQGGPVGHEHGPIGTSPVRPRGGGSRAAVPATWNTKTPKRSNAEKPDRPVPASVAGTRSSSPRPTKGRRPRPRGNGPFPEPPTSSARLSGPFDGAGRRAARSADRCRPDPIRWSTPRSR